METKNFILELEYCEKKNSGSSLFDYQLSYNSIFPKELTNVLTPNEFYKVVDGINSKRQVLPHLYVALLLQSISLYIALQLMVLSDFVNRESGIIFFIFVLLHLFNAITLFLKSFYYSHKQKKFLKNINNQFLFRDVIFSTKLIGEKGSVLSVGFLGRIIFLILPFFIQLNVIYDKNPSINTFIVGYLIIAIFILVWFSILKTLVMFSKYKYLVIEPNQTIDCNKLFLLESLVISYNSPINENSLFEHTQITPGNILPFYQVPLLPKV
ncbi:hypothetical protein DDB_G0278911 [Dictyostelium discoideum AX4]|uniref:Transmembrane protein n=1 Tax=Dictyostelium discoideum TaxID=44689 RepID=Q54XI8_DICDI|nr:hypothetical protein DDB_G0278911 [Dictyostelium discoideum AX4]EAL68057.1 hypothetical protein DDB_G0278911 [Dictyostelium discoideum AX4]|eukprot:XP_647815.1 hypothetical protein DDB_G0278911 [Dictyostelium discoideum AX4]